MQIVINNLKLNFEVYGQGKPVVYLHGWGSDLKNWYSLLGELPQNFSHILLDLPGFGDSEFPDNNWGCNDYASIVNNFLNELGILNPSLVGHSFGGKIAIKFASIYKNAKKLVLISPSGVDKKSIVTNTKIKLFKITKLPLSKNLVENLKNKIGSDDYKQSGKMRKILNKVTKEYVFEDLGDVAIPALIIWGDKDNILNFSQGKIFENKITDAYLKIIWDTDHFPHIKNPEETAESILEFINE